MREYFFLSQTTRFLYRGSASTRAASLRRFGAWMVICIISFLCIGTPRLMCRKKEATLGRLDESCMAEHLGLFDGPVGEFFVPRLPNREGVENFYSPLLQRRLQHRHKERGTADHYRIKAILAGHLRECLCISLEPDLIRQLIERNECLYEHLVGRLDDAGSNLVSSRCVLGQI